jgi:transposase
MPRSSPYTIKLSSAEEAELYRRALKYTLPYFQVQRSKMILYAAQGMSNDKIANCLDTRREVVSLWRKRFFTDRLAGLEERDRPGRPRTFPPELVVQVKALACELPAKYDLPLSRWSTQDLVQQVRHLRRRKKPQHSGSPPQTCNRQASAGYSHAGQARIHGAWAYIAGLDVHQSENLRSLRSQEWHRSIGSPQSSRS